MKVANRVRLHLVTLACVAVAGGASCQLATGLSQLQEVSCVDCPDGADAPDVVKGSTDSSDVSVLPESSSPSDSSVPEDGASNIDDTSTPDAFDSGDLIDSHDAAPTCTNDLSNIHQGDFRISFTITALQNGLTGLLNQRSACSPVNPVFWSVRLAYGKLYVEMNDGTNNATITTNGPVLDDGSPHQVVLVRSALTLSVTIDNQASATGSVKANFTSLAALAKGTDPCQGGSDGTVAFQGTLEAVCVTAP